MRSTDNLRNVDSCDTSYVIQKVDNVPPYDIEDYDLLDPKDFKKYIYAIEKMVRQSFEYRQMVSYLRENMEMNKCSFYENVNNIDSYKIKIHLHHHPFTLYDIAVIVFNKRSFYHESLEDCLVAKEVMYLHYALYVGLIPLAETPHELVHNNYLFIPLHKVMGRYMEFKNMYEQFMLPEQLEVFEKNIAHTEQYIEELNKNAILDKQYVYLDVSGEYSIPSFDEVIDKMNYTIKNMNNSMSVESVPPKKELKKIMKKIDTIDGLYFTT